MLTQRLFKGASLTLDPSLQKALFDRVYDRRKAAALELERQVRDCMAKNDRTRVFQIIEQLCTFLTSPEKNANARNGGLIGLAGVSIALGQEMAGHLGTFIVPVLGCFQDPDAKTRYFACESFYNISKVCKGEILIYFNDIFVVLAKLAADTEVSVKNGAELLDRLFKDIVTDFAPHYVSVYQNVPQIRAKQDKEQGILGGENEFSLAREKAANERHMDELHLQTEERNKAMNKAFSLARFVPLLAAHMKVINPLTRNYLVGWITVFDAVPDLQLVMYLPFFLQYLFEYLSDPNTDVRVATAEALTNFLHEIRVAAEHGNALPLSAKNTEYERPDDPDDDKLLLVHTNAMRIEYVDIFEILLEQISSPDQETKATTLEWITEFLQLVPQLVVPFTPRLILVILPYLAQPIPAIRNAATESNAQLLHAVEMMDTAEGSSHPGFDSFATINALKQHLHDENDRTRLNALEWLTMLHAKSPSKLLTMEDGSVSFLLSVLSDPSEEVVLCDLHLLTQICSAFDERHFQRFIQDLLELFHTDTHLLEKWGSMIIRQLCIEMDTERVFCTLASSLEASLDLEFVGLMVQNLNMILVAAPELSSLRHRLRTLDEKKNQTLFTGLFHCWCHNAISAFCLCLLTQSYEHAYNLLRIIGEMDITLAMLIQIDKLVQLIESPIFTSLRLHLLEPTMYPYLFKCLYGLMMLLPQSSAFATLRNRLHAVNGVGCIKDPEARTRPKPNSAQLPWDELFAHFCEVQKRYETIREQQIAQTTARFEQSSLSSEVQRESTPTSEPQTAVSRLRRRANESIN
ncbi:hypothetical protein MVES_002328 [Malassezia vespertilionis]|uniref:Vacuolar protein 14 C-terminal Fig4-binding domain-containing protein n=1 Tax=Malassezia vespertilionis TaxID=2020962 RepID=A0A2N1JAS2_9BASI|nr:hypothetical protein MVES_002328 [Malassezia vespertilionis]